ncbi:hypothetical protein PUN28_009306 [Cardiocondyla obscurior]|uniref:Uncharacterized protein n=1 Tax=Cardiocondyla obscurior TaxID=286306 RepID=A0AAW2FSV0_9HYME
MNFTWRYAARKRDVSPNICETDIFCERTENTFLESHTYKYKRLYAPPRSLEKSGRGRRFQVTTSREHNASQRGKELCKRTFMNFRKSSLFHIFSVAAVPGAILLRAGLYSSCK